MNHSEVGDKASPSLPPRVNAVQRKPILSPTKISTYLECAVKYRYVYIDKIGRFYFRSRAGFSFGSTLHHVLQQFHEKGAAHTTDELTIELEQRWITAGYESPEQENEYLAAGKIIVEAYHEANEIRAELGVETIATEKTINCEMARFKLSGRVDRIDRHPDGTIEVIDYKSGRETVSIDDVRESLAMSCYQLILSKIYPEVPITSTIYCLRSGQAASSAMSPEERQEFETDLTVLGNEILDADYPNINPTHIAACETCDFLSRCERYWRAQALEELLDAGDSHHSEFGL